MESECVNPSNWLLLDNAFHSFFGVLITHVLAGEVDSALSTSGASFPAKISWLVRYFNPVNLCWRYYSILAYRLMARSWGERQLALINFEAYPFRPPIPYIVGEKIDKFFIRRLEISGILSSQGLLSMIAAYQGVVAVQSAIFSPHAGCLPYISKYFAILGLFRVMVSHWVASKVYVEQEQDGGDVVDDSHYRSNKLVAFGWAATWVFFATLASYRFSVYRPLLPDKQICMVLSWHILYIYIGISVLLFHIVLLAQGPRGLANRILYFDHWVYKLQTLGFILLFFIAMVLGIVNFVAEDFYRYRE